MAQQLLFPNFLKDKAEYLKSRAFWKEQFDKLVEEHGFSYTPYLNEEPLEYDGNPVFNAWIPKMGRGVRIIQVEAEDEGPELSAWLDSMEIKEGFVVQELVLDLVLSQSSKQVALDLIDHWLVQLNSLPEMEEIIGNIPS